MRALQNSNINNKGTFLKFKSIIKVKLTAADHSKLTRVAVLAKSCITIKVFLLTISTEKVLLRKILSKEIIPFSNILEECNQVHLIRL